MKILIADDSRTGRSYILKTLLIAGVQEADIRQAANGKEALDVFAKEAIDLLFLDINMPVMNGIEVVNVLASTGRLMDTQVVITSSLSDNSHLEALKRNGVRHFLKKPFTPEALHSLYQLLRK